MTIKTFLITGASSGIGRQLALDYANEGHRVLACGRKAAALETLVSSSSLITPLIFDCTDQQATENALSNYQGQLDLIILNAGTCEYIEDGLIDVALFKRVMEANFYGVLHCLNALQPLKPNSAVAFMSSSATFLPFTRAQAYGASKSAIDYLAHSLQVDWAEKNIQVSLISPGFVKTPLTERNDFHMPMAVNVEQASQAIRKGLVQQQFHIHFPKRFTLILKLCQQLPLSWQTRISRYLKRKAA